MPIIYPLSQVVFIRLGTSPRSWMLTPSDWLLRELRHRTELPRAGLLRRARLRTPAPPMRVRIRTSSINGVVVAAPARARGRGRALPAMLMAGVYPMASAPIAILLLRQRHAMLVHRHGIDQHERPAACTRAHAQAHDDAPRAHRLQRGPR